LIGNSIATEGEQAYREIVAASDLSPSEVTAVDAEVGASLELADIAKEIKKVGKFKQEIKKVLARDIENKKLKRGKNESLASSKIKLRSWKVALKEYLN
jgi:dTDP-4-dehydrorhamnose reductase